MARSEVVEGDRRVNESKQLQVQRVEKIKQYLDDPKTLQQLEAIVPATLKNSLTAQRVARLALIAVVKSPKLQECTPASIISSVVQLTTWGLECSGVTGEAYLVPFKNKGVMECTPIPGYRGLITLALRSEKVKSISAHLVYENDVFRLNLADDSPVNHSRPWGERGELLGGYAVAYLDGGGIVKEQMSLDEVLAIRDNSPSYRYSKSGIWVDHFEQMFRKSLIRRISHYVPLSPDIVEAFAADDRFENVLDSNERRRVIDASDIGFGPTTAPQAQDGEDNESRNEVRAEPSREADRGGAEGAKQQAGEFGFDG